jgi:hypothetical protein
MRPGSSAYVGTGGEKSTPVKKVNNIKTLILILAYSLVDVSFLNRMFVKKIMVLGLLFIDIEVFTGKGSITNFLSSNIHMYNYLTNGKNYHLSR